MTTKNSSSVQSIYMEIPDFSTKTEYYSHEIGFEHNRNQFYLYLKADFSLPILENVVLIYLRRLYPHGSVVRVLCSIAIVDQNGEKVSTQVSQMLYESYSNTPRSGGVYFISRDYLSNSTLLVDDRLTIYGEVEILENQNELNLSKLSIVDSQDLALENNLSLLESCKDSDVVIVVSGKEFKLHKDILSERSPVFAAMFFTDMKEGNQNRVELKDVDLEVFERLLIFIYGGNVTSIEKYALELLELSDRFQVDLLKKLCIESLGNNLKGDTVAQVITIADMHNLDQLKSQCVQFITANASKVMNTEGWKAMAKSRVNLLMELYQDIVIKAESYLNLKYEFE